MERKPSSQRHFLKCPCCGAVVPRLSFTRGALGRRPLQALTQSFYGYKFGTNGGGFAWSRRPMNPEEAAHVGKAMTAGFKALTKYIDDDLPDLPDPQEILPQLSDKDAEKVMDNWAREAEEELAYRLKVIQQERERRA